jgi:hypothetical protein
MEARVAHWLVVTPVGEESWCYRGCRWSAPCRTSPPGFVADRLALRCGGKTARWLSSPLQAPLF